MKILIVNYRYFQSGGPEKYMFAVSRLLSSRGHTVIPFSVKSSRNQETPFEEYFAEPIGGSDQVYYSDYKKTPKTMLQMMDRQFYSLHVKKRLEALIKKEQPDVCYLMHHYNKLSPSVVDACTKRGVPVVMRLSDFFLACPSAHLMRDSRVCEECLDRSLLRAVRHRCSKGSYAASLIKVSAMYFHRLIGVYDKVSAIVVPSLFTISRLEKVHKGNYIHIPTFIELAEKYNPIAGSYALFVGRIEEEKGVLMAVKAVEGTKVRLIIAGKSSTGYDRVVRDYITEKSISNVELLGHVQGPKLRDLYRQSRCVLFPAQWYENMPNVVLEAMMHSRPVVASDLGSLREMVAAGKTGFLCPPKDIDGFRISLQKLFSDSSLCKRMGRNAYEAVGERYSPHMHYDRLIKVMKEAKEDTKWKH